MIAFLFMFVWAVSELIAQPLFKLIRDQLEKHSPSGSASQPSNDIDSRAKLKGRVERFVLLLGLSTDLPQILILFGALKIATRIREEDNDKVSEDFFLLGNLASVAIAIGAAILLRTIS